MSISYEVIGGGVYLSGNRIEVKITSTSAGGKINYKLALKITCADLIGSPFIEEIAPTALVSTFDISGFVDQPVDVTFDYPAAGVVSAHPLMAKNVSFDIGEIWNDADGYRQEHWEALDPALNYIRVLKGKLRPYELGLLNDDNKNFTTEYINGGKFLTHLASPQLVQLGQIQKLWFLSPFNESTPCRWHLLYFVSTGGLPVPAEKTGLVDLYSPFTSGSPTGVVEFNIEPSFCEGFENFLDNLLEYHFWIEEIETETIISEVRKFKVDQKYHEKSFTLLSLNPLSGVDVIWLTGQHTEGLKTESETVYRPVPVGAKSKVPGLKTVSSGGQRSWEINTGFKSREEIMALRDLLESRERWMVDPDNSAKLIPVIIESGDYKLFDSAPEFIPNFEVKILEAHK